MDAVEWVEIVTLVVLIVLVVPIYRYLGAYTKLLINQQRVIRDQDVTLMGNTRRLEEIRHQVDDNAAELRKLREGIAMIRDSFAMIGVLLETDTSEDPHQD